MRATTDRWQNDESEIDVHGGSMAGYVRLRGRDLLARTESFYRWQQGRRAAGLWSYGSAIHEIPAPTLAASNDRGDCATGLNFGSQDYLSLSSHPRVAWAAREALARYGPHSAGSPALQGNTTLSRRLERELAEALDMPHVTLFSTGWSAGYGVVAGLVRPDDHVILDRLAHNCLAQGAKAATGKVSRVRHLDVSRVAAKLASIRARDAANGILVVTEGLFSMDADAPDVMRLQELCWEHGATLLVDVAHDFGAMGPGGAGSLGVQGALGKVDLVMGSFSKTFASNGGFVAGPSRAVKEYLGYYAPPHTFSNALSPVQCAVVSEALRIVRSTEGDRLRSRLATAIRELRGGLTGHGIECLGQASPIVPVPLGSEAVARETARLCFARRLFANLVEYPAVAVNNARLRMQVMAAHSPQQAHAAADIIADCLEEAGGTCSGLETVQQMSSVA